MRSPMHCAPSAADGSDAKRSGRRSRARSRDVRREGTSDDGSERRSRSSTGGASFELPPEHGQRWDRGMDVPVPTSIDLRRENVPASEPEWKTFPWHEKLDWVAELPRLSASQHEFLRRVHDGFVEGSFDTLVPLKYRSLQLTGDEKRLLTLSRSTLFGSERLRMEDLGCARELTPLAWEPISDGPRAIAFENASPFIVARDALRRVAADTTQRDAPYGVVIYGGGKGFERSIEYLGTIERPIERIEYVGDLDGPGLEIARAAQRTAHEAGLPSVEPATAVHRAMLDSARRLCPGAERPGWPAGEGATEGASIDALEFLAPELRADVAAILEAGLRVPEETLGPEELAAVWG